MKYPVNTILLFVSAVLMSCVFGCTVGGNLDQYPIAYNPGGDHVVAEVLNGKQIEGELLGVDEQYVFVLTNDLTDDAGEKPGRNQIGQLHVDRVISLQIGSSTYLFPQAVRPNRIKRIALKSRYPQGISEQLLADLLDAYEQSEVHLMQ
jgi:hypothetical protein